MYVCTNFHIKGCRFTVNDDAICYKGAKGPYADQDTYNGPNKNILIEDCFFDHTTGSCMTCGSESIHVYNVLMRNCRAEGGNELLLLKMRPDTPQHYEYITVENVKGFCKALLGVSSWKQFYDLKGRTTIPKSYGSHITMHNIELKCDKFLNVNKNEAEYELSNFSFKYVKIETKFSRWNKDAFHNIRMKNVIVNGQYQQ